MKKLSLLFAASLFAFHSNAQKAYKNEIAIGMGCYEYKYRNGEAITTKNTLVFGAEKSRPWYINSESDFYALPSLHYTRRLSPHFGFALSYQYACMKYISSGNAGIPIEDYYRIYRNDDHQIQFGYNFSFLRNKIITPYIGAGFNLDIYKRTNKSYYFSQITSNNNRIDGTFFPCGSIGFSAKIYKQFSLKYDAAITTDNELLLVRPINRLSVNYQF